MFRKSNFPELILYSQSGAFYFVVSFTIFCNFEIEHLYLERKSDWQQTLTKNRW